VTPRSMFAVILALVLGGSTAVGVNNFVNQKPTVVNPDLVKVVVAAVDLPRGALLTSTQLKEREIPKEQVPPRALTKMEDALNRAVMTPMFKDEPLHDGRLAPKGSRGSMASVTKSGMRAFTIQTHTHSAGVAGFVMPGDRVDVLLTMTSDAGDASGGASTTTLLQNVEVMAVDQAIEAPALNKVDLAQMRSVTLHVTPDQALVLDLGQSKGMLHLSLRNSEDGRDARTRPATLADLRFHQERPWDERVKGVLEAFGKALEKRPPAAPPVQVVEKPPAPPPRVFIRTIRGIQEGAVTVLSDERASDDK
jgi:pilus assembly protein CpaB